MQVTPNNRSKQTEVFIKTMRVVACRAADACYNGQLTPRQSAAIFQELSDDMLNLAYAVRAGDPIPFPKIQDSAAVKELLEANK